MGLRDFFKTVREKKFTPRTGSTANNGMSDEEIAANWVKCKSCSALVHKSKYAENLNICPECGQHGRFSTNERISLITDSGSFKEFFADIEAGSAGL